MATKIPGLLDVCSIIYKSDAEMSSKNYLYFNIWSERGAVLQCDLWGRLGDFKQFLKFPVVILMEKSMVAPIDS